MWMTGVVQALIACPEWTIEVLCQRQVLGVIRGGEIELASQLGGPCEQEGWIEDLEVQRQEALQGGLAIFSGD